jgi:hypothetical protein
MRHRRLRSSVFAFGLAAFLGVLSTVPALAATTVVVTPADMQGWFFCDDQTNCGGIATGSIVSGPGAPPLGSGSARLLAPNTSDGQTLMILAHQGTRLDSISTLMYSTYVSSGGPPQAIALQFDIDFDATDTNTSFQGRLVFEPYHSQTVVAGQWQTWDTRTSSGSGSWWFTRAPSNQAANCPQSNPCTWSEVLAKFPNIAVLGRTIFKAGSGWSNFDGNVDALTIGINGNDTTYNFEPFAVVQDKDDCKDGGWQHLHRANGTPFKNQGDCVSYTNTSK